MAASIRPTKMPNNCPGKDRKVSTWVLCTESYLPPTTNSYVETLTLSAIVCEDGAFKYIIKVKRSYKGGAPGPTNRAVAFTRRGRDRYQSALFSM